jgi:hypothetical protein
MKQEQSLKAKLGQIKELAPTDSQARKGEGAQSPSQRWTAAQRARLPHKMGLPLGSGGCGDAIER